MCRKVTIRILAATGVLMSVGFVFAQSPVLDWRHIGNSAVELSLPSVATGPVDRVWYSEDGSVLYARTATGRIFETTDFEQWRRSTDAKIQPPSAQNPAVTSAPEPGLRLASQPVTAGRVYGGGRHPYPSPHGCPSSSAPTSYNSR